MSTASRYQPHYTVEDYQQWEGDRELSNGVAVSMTPNSFGRHSKLLVNFAAALTTGIDAAPCDATVPAEIDGIVSRNTVLRPGLVAVCGSGQVKHVEETPTLAVEIHSDTTRDRDLNFKRTICQNQALPTCLIVDSDTSRLTCLQLNQNGTCAQTKFAKTLTIDISGNCDITINPDRQLK